MSSRRRINEIKIVGVGYTFVVHRNIQNKISHDLIGEGKELSEFLDRSDKEPGRCHLYKMNLHVTKDLFTLMSWKKPFKEKIKLP